MTAHSPRLNARIIPAYAGSTSVRRRRRGRRWDHPRIRGEHDVAAPHRRARLGSSPHTRGARSPASCANASGRIIPAYAGSTSWSSTSSRACTDHPRIRGEHVPVPAQQRPDAGSSPHTRGARKTPASIRPSPGIIPAYAGSTPRPWLPHRTAWDHPRIRGEHDGASRQSHQQHGSSPHTRGARPGRAHPVQRHRIIPAYAGSTSPTGNRPPPPSGSSPHTRGARPLLRSRPRPRRIIPAYAGSTLAAELTSGLTGDHPRIRGEHLVDPLPSGHDGGSSPHTRGAPRS